MNRSVRKVVGALALILGFVVAALVTVHLVENYRGRKAWEAYVSEARADGRYLDFHTLLPPAIPAEQNYAATPLFEEMFAAAASGEQLRPLDFPKSELKQPSLGNISESSLADLKGWSEYFAKLKLIDGTSDDSAADILRGLERYGPRLEELRRAGENPNAHFPVQWERGWFAALMPHLSTLQQGAKLFSLRAMAHLAKGDSAAAYLDIRDGLRLCRALRGELGMISGLMRISVLQIVKQAVWQGLATDRWTDVQLARLAQDLRAFDLIEDLRFALSSERAGINSQFDFFMQMPAREIGSIFGGGAPVSAPKAAAFSILYPRGWIRQNQIAVNRSFDDALKRVDAIVREGVAKPSENKELTKLMDSTPLRRMYYAFASLLMPVVDSLESKYVLAAGSLEHVITGCALQRYRHASGKYPATLSELAPEYLSAVPRDLFAGNPMRYRATEDGRFVLWSVGQNRTDEGGKTISGQKVSKQPDLVWQYPAAQ